MIKVFVGFAVFGLVTRLSCGGAIQSRIANRGLVTAEHNQYRQNHNADDLEASFKLSAHAKYCAEWMLKENKDTRKHPCQPLENENEGENIYEAKGIGFKSDYESVEDYTKMAIQIWYDEARFIPFKRKDWFFNLKTDDPRKPIGHFTQVVWKETKSVGCAVASSDVKMIVVCRYSPPGNVFTASNIRDNVGVPIRQCKPDADYCQMIDCLGPMKALARDNCPMKCNTC